MTDFRFPERWLLDRRFSRLPSDAFAAYVCAGAWCAANRTEGAIQRADLADVPRLDGPLADMLTRSGAFEATPEGWRLTDWNQTQTSLAELDAAANARRHEREKKARQRAHAKGNHDLCTPETCEVSRGTSPGTSRGTAQDRTGQARTGGGSAAGTRASAREAEPTIGWATAQIPGGETATARAAGASDVCAVCREPMSSVIIADGYTTHPACESAADPRSLGTA